MKHCSGVCIVDFHKVNAGWEDIVNLRLIPMQISGGINLISSLMTFVLPRIILFACCCCCCCFFVFYLYYFVVFYWWCSCRYRLVFFASLFFLIFSVICVLFLSFLWNWSLLTYFSTIFHYYTPWKRQKTKG